mgnify:CR=1 FL=1
MKLNFVFPKAIPSGVISQRALMNHLGISRSTLRRRILAGLLPQPHTLAHQFGSTYPRYFNIADIESLREPSMTEAMASKSGEESQYNEIKRRVDKMVSSLGIAPIKAMLAEFDADYVDTLHPDNYAAFRSKLMRYYIKPLNHR